MGNYTMSDTKHLEYCIKLGNKIIQNKMESINGMSYENVANTYSKPNVNTEKSFKSFETPKRSPEIMSFRQRLQSLK